MSILDFDFDGFAKEAHQVAVEHGFWEGEKDKDLIYALIHSEWSEALEAHRAGADMVYYTCNFDGQACTACSWTEDAEGKCKLPDGHPKPEGIAVELIDGVLRIMDYLASEGETEINEARDEIIALGGENVTASVDSLPKLVTWMHEITVLGSGRLMELNIPVWSHGVGWTLEGAIIQVCRWLKAVGVDWERALKDKHEYNKTRPYKNGKRY